MTNNLHKSGKTKVKLVGFEPEHFCHNNSTLTHSANEDFTVNTEMLGQVAWHGTIHYLFEGDHEPLCKFYVLNSYIKMQITL